MGVLRALRALRGHFQPWAYSARDRRRQMTALTALSHTGHQCLAEHHKLADASS
jgi:hypothetical protein